MIPRLVLCIALTNTLASTLENGESSIYTDYTKLLSHLDCKGGLFQECFWKERSLINRTVELIRVQREALSFVIRQKEELTKTVFEIEDRTEYLGNLLNTFSLVHRMAKVWPPTLAMLNAVIAKPVRELPIKAEKVWNSGLSGVARLQETYNISTEELSSGRMEGAYSHANMTAGDCFDIAVYYYKLQHQERSVEWLLAALQRSRQDHSVSRERLLEYLHLAQCFKGDLQASADTHHRLQREFPSFLPSAELLKDYSASFHQGCREQTQNLTPIENIGGGVAEEVQHLRRLCRKDLYRHPDDPRLRCRLVHYNLPHLKIAPFKVEEFNLNPPLLKFYDVMHDGEIGHIRMYQNRTRLHVKYDYVPPGTTEYYLDTQQNAWINEDDPIARRITRRSAMIANLGLYQAEPSMLGTYGLAGEIQTHSDCAQEGFLLADNYTEGDYMTLIYYLNDVPEGGSTIFPKLNITVEPDKGSAIAWFNRNSDWSCIEELDHAGCPIVRGSKWIMIKWFHARRQDYPKCVPGKEKSLKHYYL